MRNRRRQNSSPVERLRLAIDCLPVATREAMLAGVRANERIIAGAYRAGGRTDLLSFAKSWDRFARAAGCSRAATERELRILVAQLEDSLMSSGGLELDVAIKEHRALMRSRVRTRRRLADAADPSGEIVARRLRTRSLRSAQSPSPGRTNIISGTTQAGETLSR
jgi:hypothetical protein